MSSDVGSAEIHFAKRLANTDKKIRDQALKRLHKWISSKIGTGNGLEQKDMINLSRGLFYCMWFSDKPLIQEELCDTLAETVQLFVPASEQGIRFIKAFFDTLGKEWYNIDRLRMDKFYLLAKRYIRASFRYLSNAGWSDHLTKAQSEFLTSFLQKDQNPDSLKMFWAEYYLKELTEMIETLNVIPSDQAVLNLLDPFFSYIAYCSSQSVRKMICTEVLNKLSTIELVSENEKGEIVSKQMPLEIFADRLYELAKNKSVNTKRRKKLFHYIDLYRKNELKETQDEGKLCSKEDELISNESERIPIQDEKNDFLKEHPTKKKKIK